MSRRALLGLLLAAPALAAGAPQGPLVDRIARRYGVAPAAAEYAVALAHKHYPEDPRLMLALIGIESRFRVWAVGPYGEVGLCQVMPGLHGVTAAQLIEPEVNVRTGAQFLRRCVRALGVRRGLAKYNGAGAAAARYADKVLREREVLHG